MDNPLHVTAFDALVDRGVSPVNIDEKTLQDEIDNYTASKRVPEPEKSDGTGSDDLESWRLEKTSELFCHVEIMVERLRALVDADKFNYSEPETRETIQRLNLSARSIHHLSVAEDAAMLMRVHSGGREERG